MNNFKTRYTLTILLLLTAATIVFFLQRGSTGTATKIDIKTIPLKVGEWQGKDLPIDELTTDILETDAVLLRIYENPEGRQVAIAIVYYQDNRVALHLPESCLSGAGSLIVKEDVEPIQLSGQKDFDVNLLQVKGDKGNQVVVYYFESTGTRTASYKDMRWQRMMNKLRSRSNNGALVRFSTVSSSSPEEDLAVVKSFMALMAPVLTEKLFEQ